MKAFHVNNLTRGTCIVERGRVADNPLTRMRGLIGVKHLPEGDGLWIKPCNGIHCMFMSIAIDVIYLDKDQRVIALDHAREPWTVGRIHRGGKTVVELPAGRLARTDTQIGDQLRIDVKK